METGGNIMFTDLCPQGHELQQTQAPSDGHCDAKHCDIMEGDPCFFCEECDHAVCQDCFTTGRRDHEQFAASTIQSKARMSAARRRFKVIQAAVLAIQTSWRGFAVRRTVGTVMEQGRHLRRRASIVATKSGGAIAAGKRRMSSPIIKLKQQLKSKIENQWTDVVVGGNADIQSTGKGERVSTLLEVLGLISALMLALAMDGFGSLGDDEFEWMTQEWGEEVGRSMKWRICLSLFISGGLCVCVLFGARHDFGDDFCQLKAPCCTAMYWIFIPAYCFAIP